MLYRKGKEGGTICLFPEIKASIVPVLSDVRQVVLDDRPNDRARGGRITVVNEPSRVGNERGGSERRPITLRAPPGSGECGLVDVELGFTQASAKKTSRRIGNGLDVCLRTDVVLNLLLQGRRVRGNKRIYQTLEGQSRVASPGVEV